MNGQCTAKQEQLDEDDDSKNGEELLEKETKEMEKGAEEKLTVEFISIDNK